MWMKVEWDEDCYISVFMYNMHLVTENVADKSNLQ